MHHSILYVCLPSLPPLQHETSHSCFMESVNTTQKLSFSSSKLRYSPFGFNPRKFRQHFSNEMKLNKIDEV